MKTRLLLPLCTLALLLAAPAYAQAPDASPEPAPAAHDDTPGEGIGVSGAWTITVRESDGTLVEQHDFHNALLEPGVASLAAMVAGLSQSGFWVVTLGSPGGVCLDSDSAPTACSLLEVDPSTAGWEGSNPAFNVLTVSTSEQNEVVLRGTFTPNNTTTSDITEVSTQVMICDIGRADKCIDPSTGDYPNPSTTVRPFTRKQLDAPLSVEPGQTITVEVVIGFSSATTAAATAGAQAGN